VKVAKSKLCNYEFDAMRCPLTCGDIDAILGPQGQQENLKHPYCFQIRADDGAELFQILEGRVRAIVSLTSKFDNDQSVSWDIPTAAEWLELAGCEDHHYPWGDEQPTRDRANLNFGEQVKIRPVGTYRSGASPSGALDCCGNVHEIVRLGPEDHFPDGFRLAGGCFQTVPERASCQIFRRFHPKSDDNRKNVGLRLIRYRNINAADRWAAVKLHIARFVPKRTSKRG
jgi:hypothetical protein